MTAESKGRDLFIVDNSVSGWTGLRYLEEWSNIARAFDVATGYFEIDSLLALDGRWQPLEKIRILMGAETTHRHPQGPARGGPGESYSAARRKSRGRKGGQSLPPRSSGDPGCAPVGPDRVPRLRQGQVRRQGLHHAREGRGGRCPGPGRGRPLVQPGGSDHHDDTLPLTLPSGRTMGTRPRRSGPADPTPRASPRPLQPPLAPARGAWRYPRPG